MSKQIVALLFFTVLLLVKNSYALTAVGSYYDSNQYSLFPLSYYSIDNGQSWQISTKLPLATTYSRLTTLSCAKSDNKKCIALGNMFHNGQAPISYFSMDGGITWDSSNTPPPHQGVDGSLNYISSAECDMAGTRCAAIGFYDSLSMRTAGPIAYYTTDSGKNWFSSSTSLNPTKADTTILPKSLDCDIKGQQCIAIAAVSDSTNNTTFSASYISFNGGKDWQPQTDLPVLPNSHSQVVKSIACDSSAQTCVAVGLRDNLPIAYYTKDSGKSWTLVNSFQIPPFAAISELDSVSCDKTGQNCAAIGSYWLNTSASVKIPLNYYSTDGGKTWTMPRNFPIIGREINKVFPTLSCDSSGKSCSAIFGLDIDGIVRTFNSQNGGIDWSESTTSPASLPGKAIFDITGIAGN